MSQKYDKLRTLLKDFFQLDQSDLEFGLYPVMHAKSAEVSQIARRWSRPAESRQRQRPRRRFLRRGRCSRARGVKLEPPGLQLRWRDAELCSHTAMPRTRLRQPGNRLFLVSRRKSPSRLLCHLVHPGRDLIYRLVQDPRATPLTKGRPAVA